jgi:pathogenesis-related protein 1
MKAWRDFGIIGTVASLVGCIALLGPSLIHMRGPMQAPNHVVFEQQALEDASSRTQSAALITALDTTDNVDPASEDPTTIVNVVATSAAASSDTNRNLDIVPQIIPDPVNDPVLTDEEERILMLHNKARAAQGVSPLAWSDALERSALSWADTLVSRTCTLAHSGKAYGENIYYSRKYGAEQKPQKPEEVMDSFLAEEIYYDHTTNSCVTGEVCGHYTQIMWARTTEVGCAKSLCASDADGRKEIWVCHYSPQGNIEGLRPY